MINYIHSLDIDEKLYAEEIAKPILWLGNAVQNSGVK
tara:strand:- start:352 stop:462 length:111 start_codon:yes stop_codon:yes gene_type:complete